MEKNLTFNESYTVEQFKAKVNLKPDQPIQVKKNPNTDKLFFTWGPGRNQIGAVASAGVPKKPVISNVTGNDGVTFFLLHEEGNGGAPVIATF